MRINFPRPVFIALCCASLCACSPSNELPDPKTLPYTLDLVRILGGPNTQAIDLDGDGRDEIVGVYTPNQVSIPLRMTAIWLQTHDGQTIEQVNYEGQVLQPHFGDLDRDGVREMLVPLIRNDSLFLSVTNLQGRKLYSFFLVAGKPRKEPEGTIPWDPRIENFYLMDIDADGRQELVTILITTYARLPRGILVHSLPDGKLLGKKVVGAGLSKSFFDDFDGDGYKEIVFAAGASNNGAVANGFDDLHSYFIAFDVAPAPEVSWSKEMGGLWSYTTLAYVDFDGNGQREFLAFTWTASSEPEEARLELIEPGTWRVLRRRAFAEPLFHPQAIDLDHDTRPEILAIRSTDEIWVFDEQFEVVHRHHVTKEELSWLSTWPDVDGDGVDEIVAKVESGILLLDPDLHVKATYPVQVRLPGPMVPGVMRRGIGVPPYLLFVERDNQGVRTLAMELVKNPFYWLYRYGPWALWMLGIAAILGVAIGMHRQHARNRLLERFQSLVLDTDDQGVFLLAPNGRVERMNATLRHWLGIDGRHRVRRARLDEVFNEMPALAAFCEEALARHPPHHHEGELLLEVEGRKRAMQAVAEPIPVPSKEHPHWLIRLEGRSKKGTMQDDGTWAMVVGKVAHEFKNPAAGLLLTTQQLQAIYRKHAPALSALLDPYAESIIERTEHLRRLSNNFMKFVGAEALRLVETNVNVFVQDVAARLRPGIASDINLTVKPSSALPTVLLDRELIRTVLENLIINALNAMPEGGVITLATGLVSNLQTLPQDAPRDYVVLEVRDTGNGIAPADRERLFELGFSTSMNGVGLGLAIVKKAVEDHGGYVKVESEPGVGSIFSIYLPVIS